jgi:hypothetical protein
MLKYSLGTTNPNPNLKQITSLTVLFSAALPIIVVGGSDNLGNPIA